MKIILHKSTENILIYCKEGIVYKVNKRFVSLTGYLENEVIGKSIDDLSTLLRLDSQIDLKETNNIDNVYMFIKGDNPRKVNISSKYIEGKKERIYLLEEIDNPLLDYILENIFSFDIDDKQSIVVYSIDNYILLKSNRQYIELLSSLNISTENLLGRPPIFPPFLLNCSKNINYGHETEISFTNKDGSNSYFDVSTIPLYEDGKEKYLLNIINDVTERVLSRNDLKREKEKIETILDNVSDKVVVFNNKGDHVYVNKSARKRIDASFNINLKNNKTVFKESKLTTMEGDIISFDSTPSQRVLKGESFSDYRYIGSGKYNMAYYNVLGIPLYDNRKKLTEGVVIYKDITHKIIMEEYNILKEKTMDYSLIYGTISYPDLKIMYINEQGYRCIGYFNSNIKNLFSLIDKSLFELCSSSEEEKIKLINGIKNSIEKRETSFTFIEKIVKNNESKYFKIIFQPLYDKDNKVNKISLIGMDITKEKTTNEKLNNDLKFQEEMFVNASHELKTPLNLIFSASQLLDQNLKKNDSVDDNNEINYSNKVILRNCYRLTKLIDNILDISKLESGFYKLNLTNEHIVDVTEDIIQSVAKYIKEKGFKIVFDTEIEEKIIGLDLYKFDRIMLNLISNAIKFSDENGTIFVNLYDKGDFIEITVEDEGIGIAKENLEIIFDKFHQVNKSLTRISEGSGIGLSLVKSLVKLHSGEISVESTLGKGTKFTIKLPAITVDKQSENTSVNNNGSREEMIKFELSDIY